jgi:hypothetical protein
MPTIIVKSDVIWIRPVPEYSKINGITIFVPSLETETNTGIIYRDIVEGQGDYQLPPGITADDVADVRAFGKELIDFK